MDLPFNSSSISSTELSPQKLGDAFTSRKPERVTVLGATGSIGVSTLDVLSRHPDKFSVYALAADRKWQVLATQCLEHRPEYAVLNDADAAKSLAEELRKQGSKTQVLQGADAFAQIAAADSVDTVMAAIVGAAGLLPTLAAVKAGKKVLLANKESLVMAGGIFTQAVIDHGATLLPIDSEHNAIFQCMPSVLDSASIHSVSIGAGSATKPLLSKGVRKILLTASGGPFRNTPVEQLVSVAPEQACAHPNWSMGRKISVDSATMANKGLELIEACWLFNAQPEQIQVVIHPQSVIHSLVEYLDGSVLAQLGNPDMRTPIAHALAWPHRIASGVASLDLIATARLDFAAPDYLRFPCLGLAEQAAKAGGNAACLFNAANEVAVAAFLERRLRFDQISALIDSVLSAIPLKSATTLEAVLAADQEARHVANTYLAKLNHS